LPQEASSGRQTRTADRVRKSVFMMVRLLSEKPDYGKTCDDRNPS
jgi:hypothetical protein